MNIHDENLTPEEKRLLDKLKDKNRMEQDEIIGEWENGCNLRRWIGNGR